MARTHLSSLSRLFGGSSLSSRNARSHADDHDDDGDEGDGDGLDREAIERAAASDVRAAERNAAGAANERWKTVISSPEGCANPKAASRLLSTTEMSAADVIETLKDLSAGNGRGPNDDDDDGDEDDGDGDQRETARGRRNAAGTDRSRLRGDGGDQRGDRGRRETGRERQGSGGGQRRGDSRRSATDPDTGGSRGSDRGDRGFDAAAHRSKTAEARNARVTRQAGGENKVRGGQA